MRLRLIVSLMLVSLVSILLMVIIIRQEARTQVQTYLYRGGMFGADRMVAALEDYYRRHSSWEGIAERIDEIQHGSGMGMMRRISTGALRTYRLYDREGRLVWDGSNSPSVSALTPEEHQRSIRLQDVSGDSIGYLLIVGVASPVQQADEENLVNILNEAAVRAAVIAALIALLIALILGAGLLRPVRQVTAAAQKIAEGDLSQQVPVQGDDELASLARSFNTMSESLRRSEERRRKMTADIAHELRTPISVQRAHLEALLDGVYEISPENIKPVLEQTELLTRLVDDLRTLALVDSGELELEYRWVDLARVVAEAVENFQSSAAHRRVELVWQSQPPASIPPVWGDADRLVQILNNLLSNALRFTPEGGKIRLTLNHHAGGIELSVRDSGEGIPFESLPHIFERFYRADHARSRDLGGSGLGLAIARQLAKAHGGDLAAANHPQGGAVFTLRLPPANLQT